MAPTSAAHYRRTATTARRPVPALATVQTSARSSAWGDREEASERREFLVPEPSPASAVGSADLNIIRLVPKARPVPAVSRAAMQGGPREAAEWKAPVPATASTASASATVSAKRA